MTMWLAVSLIGFLYLSGMVTTGILLAAAHKEVGSPPLFSRRNATRLVMWPVFIPYILVRIVFE